MDIKSDFECIRKTMRQVEPARVSMAEIRIDYSVIGVSALATRARPR